MLPRAWKAWNSGRVGNFAFAALRRSAGGGERLRTTMTCEGAPDDGRRGCQLFDVKCSGRRRVLIRMILLQRSDDFLLAKSGWQAEHLCLPTQSRAELQKKETANGTRRQKSPRSPVHRAGGPFPKR